MSIYEELLKEIQLPKFYKVKQSIDSECIQDVAGEIKKQLLSTKALERIHAGDRIAVTVGSREIANYALIIKTLCDSLKEKGANPFIIPAMGSHGGAIAENQKALIAHFGIDEEHMEVPVLSSMDTVYLGETSDKIPVFFDKNASHADGIVVVGRIKIHTCFRGEIESGLMKMLAIGCGKQKGAAALHKRGFAAMSKNVTETARVCLEKMPVLFGMGILENACHQTRDICVMPAEEIEEKEKEILKISRRIAPKIPFDKVDVLIVDEMGKNISGTGMDPNITGRSSPLGMFEPYVERLAVLDLTEESDGSAYGVGNADVITNRLFSKIIMDNTYPNGLTNRDGKPMMIPPVMPNDKTALLFALGTLTGDSLEQEPRVVWLHNTLCMDSFYISESLLSQANEVEAMSIEERPYRICFDMDGNVECFQKL